MVYYIKHRPSIITEHLEQLDLIMLQVRWVIVSCSVLALSLAMPTSSDKKVQGRTEETDRSSNDVTDEEWDMLETMISNMRKKKVEKSREEKFEVEGQQDKSQGDGSNGTSGTASSKGKQDDKPQGGVSKGTSDTESSKGKQDDKPQGGGSKGTSDTESSKGKQDDKPQGGGSTGQSGTASSEKVGTVVFTKDESEKKGSRTERSEDFDEFRSESKSASVSQGTSSSSSGFKVTQDSKDSGKTTVSEDWSKSGYSAVAPDRAEKIYYPYPLQSQYPSFGYMHPYAGNNVNININHRC